MRRLTYLVLVAMMLLSPISADEEDSVSLILDDFHQAASVADGHRYFNHFAPDGIFLGTDITERWTVDEFKAYAEPHFKKGNGWTYHVKSRKVYLSPRRETAWFDEILHNESYGKTRGTGVLVKIDGRWRIAQYHLTLPVPNNLMKQVVDMIEAES